MDAGVQHESSSLSAYVRVLRRRKWIVLACAMLVPSTALLLSLRQTDLYRSSAAVYLNKQNIASAVTGIPDTTLLVDEERAAETQVNLASVPDVARRPFATRESAACRRTSSSPGRPRGQKATATCSSSPSTARTRRSRSV